MEGLEVSKISTYYDETHSITFGELDEDGNIIGKNTWTDWHLIPASRPTMSMAPVTTKFVDIPGRKDGPYDLSEYLTGSPIYGSRSGSFEFIVDNDHENWIDLKSKIVDYLHGKRMKMIFSDDPAHYYEGRFTVAQWNSGDTNSSVTINYVVGPYKYGLERWKWNPFNFDTMNTGDFEDGRL